MSGKVTGDRVRVIKTWADYVHDSHVRSELGESIYVMDRRTKTVRDTFTELEPAIAKALKLSKDDTESFYMIVGDSGHVSHYAIDGALYEYAGKM